MPRSKNLIWILALAALGYFFGQQPYVVRGGNLRNQVLSYDVAGYYAYLPMLFVERDLRLEKTWKYDMIQLVGVHEHPVSGGRHLKFTAGMAYLYAPFFAAAHAYTLATNPEEAHGFSLPYRFGIGLAGVVYPLVGLVFLRRFLRHYVPDAAISWTLFALFLGTNLFYYSSFRGAMSHGATFMLGAAMLYQADLWRRREQVWRLGVLGVLAGLIVLIRPVNVLIPLAVAAMFTMDGRLPKGLLTPKSLAVALGLAVVVGIPQLLYWKASTGHWIVWTYGAERFFWSQPAWIQGLFSWRKGWLLYTPMVAFILLGFWGLARKKPAWALIAGLYLIATAYVTFSWWAWWYGGSFGSRPMIDGYALLALPLAVYVQRMLEEAPGWIRRLSLGTVCALVALNLVQTYHYTAGFLHHDSMTRRAYVYVLTHWDFPPRELLEQPDYESALEGRGLRY
ncbi:MAG: hypothetical protein LW601_06770 [Cryomorphaceae bacterium]|nr:hypothetical protein [Cryomorphaceae bacterium]